ncbi:7565_t:CDS:2 [Racocetra fulgida]|uniref:7565_t:CDS:1 n=1 Tax=Racocetra fulgida TaxID=60492 RepID=A0A9N9AMD9_9GLOM|nr:7565_t:CDS:2 [Racocetra fulgida]
MLKADVDGSPSTSWQENLSGTGLPTTTVDTTTITTTSASPKTSSLNIEHFDLDEQVSTPIALDIPPAPFSNSFSDITQPSNSSNETNGARRPFKLPASKTSAKTKKRRKSLNVTVDSIMDDSFVDMPLSGGYTPASSKRNAEFHALFRSVPEEDFLINALNQKPSFNESEYTPNKSSEASDASSESSEMSDEGKSQGGLHKKFELPKLKLDRIRFVRSGSSLENDDSKQHKDSDFESKVHSLPSSPTKSGFEDDALLKGSKGHRLKSKSMAELKSSVLDITNISDLKASETSEAALHPISPRTQSRHLVRSNTNLKRRRASTQCPCLRNGQHYENVSLDATFTGTVEKLYNLIMTSGFVKRFIIEEEKSSIEGQQQYWQNLAQEIKKYIAVHPSEFQDESGSPVRERVEADEVEKDWVKRTQTRSKERTRSFQMPTETTVIEQAEPTPTQRQIAGVWGTIIEVQSILSSILSPIFQNISIPSTNAMIILDNIGGNSVPVFGRGRKNEFFYETRRQEFASFLDDRIENEDVLWQWLSDKSKIYEDYQKYHDQSENEDESLPISSQKLHEEIEDLHKLLQAAEGHIKKLSDIVEFEKAYYQEKIKKP